MPSPRAEPVRLWLAQVGEERILEIEHPEAALDRLRARLRAKGYEDAWIEERIKNDLIRNELTDESMGSVNRPSPWRACSLLIKHMIGARWAPSPVSMSMEAM